MPVLSHGASRVSILLIVAMMSSTHGEVVCDKTVSAVGVKQVS